MAPKQRNTAAAASPAPSSTSATPAAAATPSAAATTISAVAKAPGVSAFPSKTNSGGGGGAQAWDRIVGNVLAHYLDTTPQRTKLLDAFMAFLVAVGALQFVYCVLAGNYVRFCAPPQLTDGWLVTNARGIQQPFNAFLSGFSATVGQFVLTGTFSKPTIAWDCHCWERVDAYVAGNSFVEDPDDRGEQGGLPLCVARAVSLVRFPLMWQDADADSGPLRTTSCAA
jgi:oligosaccharyltransferase complex subunit epsilon